MVYSLFPIKCYTFVGIAMVVVQCLFSNLWLKYHSHGPFEGIWKKLTWIKF
nr:DUF418 domain-containing protein [Segatella copri]